jgi:hypothetical protein
MRRAETPTTTRTTIHTVAIEIPPPAPVKAVPPFEPEVPSTLALGLSGYPAAARAEGALTTANATALPRAQNSRFMIGGSPFFVGHQIVGPKV